MSTQVSNAQIATRSSSLRRSHRQSRRAMVCVSAATPGSANQRSVAAAIVGAILKFPPLGGREQGCQGEDGEASGRARDRVGG